MNQTMQFFKLMALPLFFWSYVLDALAKTQPASGLPRSESTYDQQLLESPEPLEQSRTRHSQVKNTYTHK